MAKNTTIKAPKLSEKSKARMQEAEQQIADYLTRCGLMDEKGIHDETRAEALRKRRQEHYHNISSLLDRYRSLKRTYAVFQDEFAEEVLGTDAVPSDGLSLFDTISKRLDVLSVTEEKKFQRYYAPHITAGRKIEVALRAVDFGLRILEAEDPSMFKIVNMVYIDGTAKPTIQETSDAMGYQSFNSYYKKLEQAKKRLTELVFGYADNREELLSILTYLRQQAEDEDFPYTE